MSMSYTILNKKFSEELFSSVTEYYDCCREQLQGSFVTRLNLDATKVKDIRQFQDSLLS